MTVISVVTLTSVSPSAGLKVTLGGFASVVVNLALAALRALSETSSTVEPMETLYICSLSRSALRVSVTSVLSSLTTASNPSLFPSASLSTVTRATTLSLSRSVPLISRTGSLKVSFIWVSTGTSTVPSEGVKATVGGSESATMNVVLVARMALSWSSSTVAPMAA